MVKDQYIIIEICTKLIMFSTKTVITLLYWEWKQMFRIHFVKITTDIQRCLLVFRSIIKIKYNVLVLKTK